MNRRMLVTAVILGTLTCAAVGQASAPLNVSVALDGPDVGLAGEGLDYLATGSFDLDGATQTEVASGEATVEEEYTWGYAPGPLRDGAGKQPGRDLQLRCRGHVGALHYHRHLHGDGALQGRQR